MKIFFLPFAGGNELSYKPLADRLAIEGIASFQCNLPGRGKRIGETLLDNISDMSLDVFRQIQREAGDEYILFGHSMGALLATHLLQVIDERKYPRPSHIFLSGRGGRPYPHTPPYKHQMDSASFWEMIAEFGGIPEEILEEEDIRDFFEPILRSDFKAVEVYNPIHINLQDLEVSVFYGNQDKYSREEMLAWQRITACPVNIEVFEGGHFFVLDKHKEVAEKIIATISGKLKHLEREELY